MFGDEIMRNGYYFELMLNENETARLIVCMNTASVLMYRIEWIDEHDTDKSYWYNKAEYNLPDAITTFREKSGIATCAACGKGIYKDEPQVDNNGHDPDGMLHMHCYDDLLEDYAAEQKRERLAERRNEEVLYGYELPSE